MSLAQRVAEERCEQLGGMASDAAAAEAGDARVALMKAIDKEGAELLQGFASSARELAASVRTAAKAI